MDVYFPINQFNLINSRYTFKYQFLRRWWWWRWWLPSGAIRNFWKKCEQGACLRKNKIGHCPAGSSNKKYPKKKKRRVKLKVLSTPTVTRHKLLHLCSSLLWEILVLYHSLICWQGGVVGKPRLPCKEKAQGIIRWTQVAINETPVEIPTTSPHHDVMTNRLITLQPQNH